MAGELAAFSALAQLSNHHKCLAAPLQHPAQRQLGAGADGLWDDDLRCEIAQTGLEFFEGVHLHVAAVGARAFVRRAGDEFLARHLASQAVEHPAFRDNDE